MDFKKWLKSNDRENSHSKKMAIILALCSNPNKWMTKKEIIDYISQIDSNWSGVIQSWAYSFTLFDKCKLIHSHKLIKTRWNNPPKPNRYLSKIDIKKIKNTDILSNRNRLDEYSTLLDCKHQPPIKMPKPLEVPEPSEIDQARNEIIKNGSSPAMVSFFDGVCHAIEEITASINDNIKDAFNRIEIKNPDQKIEVNIEVTNNFNFN